MHPRDAFFINRSLENYDRMKIIFVHNGFTSSTLRFETLRFDLSHLMDNKGEGINFLVMTTHETKQWFPAFLRKHCL